MSISDNTAFARPWAQVGAATAYIAAAAGLPYYVAGVQPSLPNTVAGGTLLACGLLILDGGDRRLGRLLVLAGIAWFAPDFAPVFSGPTHSAVEATSLLYVGLLVHGTAIVCDPWLTSPMARLTTVLGYGVAVTAATGIAKPGLLLLGAALVLLAWDTVGGKEHIDHEQRWLGPVMALVLAAGLLIPTSLRLASSPLSEPALSRVLVLAVTSLGILGVAASRERSGSRLAVTLDASASMALAEQVGSLIGQGPVNVVFPSSRMGPWVDFSGLAVDVNADDLTVVGERNTPIAGLPPRTSIPGPVADDLTQFVRLAGDHARLNFLIRQRTADVATSRRRLVESGDDERRRLESALRRGAGASLDQALGALPNLPGLLALRQRAAATKAGLDSIARGIDPLADRGLREGLEDLAAHAGVPVSIAITQEPSRDIARSIWFACSEAVANVEKYAPASRIAITVDGEANPIRVQISDNGPGGADPDGRGLRGLADRASALGGVFTVTSTESGTRLVLTLPRREGPS